MYNLGDAVGYIRLEMGKFLQEAQQAQTATKDIENEFDKLGNTAKSIEGIIVKSFAAIGAAVVAGLGQAVNVGSQFEASMSQVAATMGMTADDVANGSADFEKLSAAAKEMGETTKFSASQAADALNYLALAGYNTEQAISTLPTVLNLAASGGMDLARASDMITDAASALGLSINDMSLFADKMAKAAQSSNTSVEQLGNAILQIGGTAKNLSGGITELNTALGILANNGIKSAEGGTALRQVILNLTAPTEKAAAYMEELGLKVADAAGNVRPLNEIFKDLDEILQSKGITGSADKIKALSQIFDARQLKSATALLNNYGESWDRLYEKIDNAEGAASTMAETMETNLKGALTILGSTAEGFGITVYDSIESSFKNAVSEATKQLSNLNNAFKSAEMQQSLQKISDAISKAIVKLSEFLSDIIPKLVSGFSDLIDNFDKISAGIAGLGTTIGLAAAGMTLFKVQTDLVTQSLIAQKLATLAANAALLANPYTLVAVGIGVLVAALVNEYNQQQQNIEQLDKLNEKYYEAEDAVNQMADNYDKQIAKAEELNNSNDEQIAHINDLLELIQKNTDETGKMTGNYELVKDAIDELNSILPINIQYQGTQITNYADLVQGSKAYCEQLKNEAILEAKKEEYKTASVAYDEAIKKREDLTNSFLEAQKAYQDVSYAWEKMNNEINGYVAEYQEEAKAAGMEYRDYVNSLYETSKRALDSTEDAYLENERIIRESSETLKQAEIDIAKTTNEIYAEQLKTGQEVTGIYASESEARIAIAESEAKKLAEINRQSHQERIEEIQENTDDAISEEEALEAALEQLEIQYNTGVIASDEEYHRRRLELLENFHGEWSKKSSSWLKSELDWEQKQKDDAIKEEGRRLQEQQRQREKEQREAEQAEREKERLFKEETNAKIQEIDRRKELDENYTDEMYLADLQALAETLDKRSDLYKDLVYKIQKYQKQITDNQKKELEQQNKDAFNALKERKYDIDDTTKNYNLTDYLKDLNEFLATLEEGTDLYKQVQKEIIKTEQDITKQKEKQIETDNKNYLDSLKNKLKEDEAYTKEMYLNDLLAFAETLEKESAMYQTVLKEIADVREDIGDENQKTANDAFKSWEKGFNSLKSEAEKSYNEIIAKQKNLENTLNGHIKLYETRTKKIKNLTTGLWEDVEVKKSGTAYLKDQLKELENYQKQLERLKERGVSDDLMQEIMGMSEEDRKEYLQALNSMSDSSLKAYDEAYTDLKNKNKEFSEKYYAGEVEAFKTEWGKKIEDYIKTLPEEARGAAKELIENFISGLTDFNDESFKNVFTSFISDFQQSVESGVKFKNYGENAVLSIISGIAKDANTLYDAFVNMGKTAGEKFKDAVTAVLNDANIFDNLLNMHLPDYVVNTSTGQHLVSGQNAYVKNTGNEITKDEIKSAIKESLPDGDVVLNINGDTFGKISRKQLNILSQKSGNLALSV